MNELSGLWSVPFWGAGVGFCRKCGKASPFGINSGRRGYNYCPNCGMHMYPGEETIEITHPEYTEEQLGRDK